jgi:uncharacterized membrane protein
MEIDSMDDSATASIQIRKPEGNIRNWRERLGQTLAFEAIGLLAISPLYAYFADASLGESMTLLVALSIVVMCWSAIYNTAFDLLELRYAGRVASDRPQFWRVIHAIGHEFTAVLVTWPLIVKLTNLGWIDALVADIGLTLVYTAYGYLFHMGFDRLFPVQQNSSGQQQ